MGYGIRSLVLLLVVMTGAQADELQTIRGRVVDEGGQPVAEADVDFFWRANGPGKDRNGRRLDLSNSENVRLFWGNLGQMEPFGYEPRKGPLAARTDSDGRFSMRVPDDHHAVMVMDRARKRGGLAMLPHEADGSSVEIRVGPLVRIRGALEGPSGGTRPDWTHVYAMLPEDPRRPLDSTRLVSCGSFESRFVMSLPPGRYSLHAYNDALDAQLDPDKEVILTAESPEVDLGVLRLSPAPPNIMERIKRSKAEGSWGDYSEHYGQEPPRWHVTEARGVDKDAQLADFRGRWVLLYFWGFSCTPCLKTGLPKLMKFYQEHEAERDRFEILSICIDPDEEVKSMADVDRLLAPIVKNVWNGKDLPFPVLLDSGFQTWERFGLKGLGTVLLIDPDGHLVEGDETVLARKLK